MKTFLLGLAHAAAAGGINAFVTGMTDPDVAHGIVSKQGAIRLGVGSLVGLALYLKQSPLPGSK